MSVPAILGAEEAPLVDVRDASLRLIDQIAPGGRVNVEPGLYVASLSLPTGEFEQRAVLVEEGHAAAIVLGPDRPYDLSNLDDLLAADAGKREEEVAVARQPWRHGPDVEPEEAADAEAAPADEAVELWEPPAEEFEEEEVGERSPARALLEDLELNMVVHHMRYVPDLLYRLDEPVLRAPWSLRLMSARTGEPLREGWEAHELGRAPSRDGELASVMIELPGVDRREGFLVQVAAAGAPVWSALLPVDPEDAAHDRRCALAVHIRRGAIRASASLRGGSQVETIADYMRAGRISEAARVAVGAEWLLGAKKSNPIGAALGAYALLRLGKLDRLHDWAWNLMRWFEWLPDGAVVAAEQAQREGDLETADARYAEALRRGIPVFSDGLSLLVSHLRSRAEREKPKRRKLAEGTTEREKPKRRTLWEVRAAKLQAIAVLAARDDLLVSYPGSDARRPASTLEPRKRITARGWQVFR